MEAVKDFAPFDLRSEIAKSVAVEINGKHTLIPKRRAVTIADLLIEETHAANGKALIRLTYKFDGQEHGIEVPFEKGSNLMGREQAIEKGRADIERSVNLVLHDMAGGDGEWKPAPRGKPVGQIPQPMAPAPAVTGGDKLVDFADAIAAYINAKTLIRMAGDEDILLSAQDAAKDRLHRAYRVLVSDLAEHVADKLTVCAMQDCGE